MDNSTEKTLFELALPWNLLLLPVPLLVMFLCPKACASYSSALRVPFYTRLVSINETSSVTTGVEFNRSYVWLLVIWSLLVIAITGPRWVGKPQPLSREGHNILLALDISPSMDIRDMSFKGQATPRLWVVKQAASQFVRDRNQDKIGLILFGSQAYLQTPLTYDHNNVLMRLDDATVGLAGRSTSLGDAIGLAVKRLQDVPNNGRVIVLLTDGANNSGVLAPLNAAKLAKTDGIKIYTIGLGASSSNQNFRNLFLSVNTTDELDEATLKKIALTTGGRYFRATDLASLKTIYKTINQMETVEHDPQSVRPQYDYYPWFVALALLLLVIGFCQQGQLVRLRKSLI